MCASGAARLGWGQVHFCAAQGVSQGVGRSSEGAPSKPASQSARLQLTRPSPRLPPFLPGLPSGRPSVHPFGPLCALSLERIGPLFRVVLAWLPYLEHGCLFSTTISPLLLPLPFPKQRQISGVAFQTSFLADGSGKKIQAHAQSGGVKGLGEPKTSSRVPQTVLRPRFDLSVDSSSNFLGSPLWRRVKPVQRGGFSCLPVKTPLSYPLLFLPPIHSFAGGHSPLSRLFIYRHQSGRL